MSSPPEQIEVKCPSCGTIFQTWHRGSINLTMDNFNPDYIRRMTTADCPDCKQHIVLGSLIVGKDNVWRFGSGDISTEQQGLPQHLKALLHSELDFLIIRIASDFKQSPETVATELFYRLQRHPKYGRNATAAQKKASYLHWKGVCQKCGRPVKREDATYHHLKRRIQDEHAPANLRPYHTECHDDEHGAVAGSLSKGSPKRKTEQ